MMTINNVNTNETPLINYYKTNKQQLITSRKKRNLLSKSPTITFGELKQRHRSSSNSNRAVFSSSASSSLFSSNIHSFSKKQQQQNLYNMFY